MRFPRSEQRAFRLVISPLGLRRYFYAIFVPIGFPDLGRSSLDINSKYSWASIWPISSLCAVEFCFWSVCFLAMFTFRSPVAAVMVVGILGYCVLRKACRSWIKGSIPIYNGRKFTRRKVPNFPSSVYSTEMMLLVTLWIKRAILALFPSFVSGAGLRRCQTPLLLIREVGRCILDPKFLLVVDRLSRVAGGCTWKWRLKYPCPKIVAVDWRFQG